MAEKPKIYQGSQWRVTGRGMERTEADEASGYYIDREVLARGISNVDASWPVHMAEKSWIDLDDFEKAYRAAVAHFGLEVPNIDEMFARARQGRD